MGIAAEAGPEPIRDYGPEFDQRVNLIQKDGFLSDRDASPQHALLIIDDDPFGREALQRRFGRHGFQVTGVSNGPEGLQLIAARRFDLILLDIQMPDMDGFQVLAGIRVLYPATNLPVIMITAKDQSEDVVQALQLGANDYITKPLDFDVVLARVQTQLSLNKTSHLLGVFRSQFTDCLEHFFPGCVLAEIEDGEPVRWRERPPHANFRLGEITSGSGIGIEWLRARYQFIPQGGLLTAAEKRLVEVIVRVLDSRYQAMFDLDMPNRLELVNHAVEDWVIAEYLWPQNLLPVLEGLKLLRVAALLTYENRKVSTGVLIAADEANGCGLAGEPNPVLPRLGSWLFHVKSLQRLCDGLHTLFLSDHRGNLRGVVEIEQWSREFCDAPLAGPCPRAYTHHAKSTTGGKGICLVLTPAQEIKVFAWGTLVFGFRGARWHLLDAPSKFAEWREALGTDTSPGLANRIFQAAMDLSEGRHGALIVVLDYPEASLAQLVSPEDRLTEPLSSGTERPRLLQQVLHLTSERANLSCLGPYILEALCTIDGALVTDRTGRVLAAGAILRSALEITGEEKSLEGARTTAAVAASYHGPVLKVSEDGVVSFLLHGQAIWHL